MPRIDVPLHVLPLDTPVRLERGAHAVVAIRTVDGVTAYEDVCPHAQWRLSEGEVRCGVLECPGHGWEFSVATGRCLTVPAYALTPCRVTVTEAIVHIDPERPAVRAAGQTQRVGEAAL